MSLGGGRPCTNGMDRWIAFVAACGIIGPCLWTLRAQPEGVVLVRDAKTRQMTWSLQRNAIMQVEGLLGPVQVEIHDHRVRLLEYQSLRLVGTMTGWISRPGQVTACIPCGVVVQIKGRARPENGSAEPYDGIAR
ncbi:MAG: NusG domain II-containing protein [Magnetococcales bacterium]|nr:NusG domain II-containing protein [Magnetococcales bacterium]